MTEEEILKAAKSDPDAERLSEAELAKPVPMPPVKLLRRRLCLTQHQFAERFQIPIGRLRDWEQCCHLTSDPIEKSFFVLIWE